MIGQKLKDRYYVREELGRGGMAIVYRARDSVLQRDVAVKALHVHLADRPDARRRLRREALAAAKLSHDHILKVFDFSAEEETGPAILVTEFVKGKTLRALYEEHKSSLPCEVAALVGVVLAEALAHAHKNEIVHRDVKPENVMFRTEDGALKLMDFGIARLLDERNITQTSALLGSPAHMAPELLRGKPADFKSDLYSLGTVLYVLATGEYPFWEETPSALLRRVDQGKFRDPEAVRPAMGRRLGRIIKKAMALNPEDRHPDAEALAVDLKAFLAEVGIEEPYPALKAFLTDVAAETPKLKARVVEALLARAKEALRARRKGAVLSHVNRVQAYEPENEAAKEILRALSARTRGMYAAALVGFLVLGAGAGFALDRVLGAGPQPKERASVVPFRANVGPDGILPGAPTTNEAETSPTRATSQPFSLPAGLRIGLRPFPINKEELIKAASRPVNGKATPARLRRMTLNLSIKDGVLAYAYIDDKRVGGQSHNHRLAFDEGETYKLMFKNGGSCQAGPYKVEIERKDGVLQARLDGVPLLEEKYLAACEWLPAELKVLISPPGIKEIQVRDEEGVLETIRNGDKVSIKMSTPEREMKLSFVDLSDRYESVDQMVKLKAGEVAPLSITLTPR